MKVHQLKSALEGLPDDMEIVLQKDPEGNGYSTLGGADPGGIYVPESGEVYADTWSADDACVDVAEWDLLLLQPRTLVLWPNS